MDNQLKIQHLLWRSGFGCSIQEMQLFAKKPIDSVVDTIFQNSAKIEPLIITDEPAIKQKEIIAASKNERKEMVKELVKESKQLGKELNLKWLNEMIGSKAQLREKMALFWHGHFACQSKSIHHAQKYLNTIRQHALGNFGDLVLAIAKEPAMLAFLNNQQNRKQKPNENFARELMELFTLGRGNYTEQDIKESARAFTGWAFDGDAYIFRQFAHDFGQKTFMGKTGDFNGEDIIKIILEKPETAQFIVTKIYKFFVNDVIDKTIVDKLAKNFYQSNYNISSLMREIFTSSWFYEEKNIGTHIKSPIELLAGLQRQLNFKFVGDESALFIQKILGQVLLFPPNVAGWAGGRNWIDSSTMLFRLKLPETIYKLSEIAIHAKEEEDIQKMSLVNQRLKKFSAEFNWTPLEQYFGKENNKEILIQSLANFFLQKPIPKLKHYLIEIANNTSASEILKEIAIALVAVPEYQVC